MAACAQLLSAPLSQLEMAACAQLLSPAWNQLARPPLDSAARAQLPRDSPLHPELSPAAAQLDKTAAAQLESSAGPQLATCSLESAPRALNRLLSAALHCCREKELIGPWLLSFSSRYLRTLASTSCELSPPLASSSMKLLPNSASKTIRCSNEIPGRASSRMRKAYLLSEAATKR